MSRCFVPGFRFADLFLSLLRYTTTSSKRMDKLFFKCLPGLAAALLLMVACNAADQRTGQGNAAREEPASGVAVPAFVADSAYYYIERQVGFGPRVPNTEAHRQAGQWLTETMSRFADTVYVQQARVRAYDGTVLNIRNIIGAFQPEKRSRVLLCAHWDSRPYADHDPDPEKHFTPIDGANDGGSGVGVLLEIARQLQMQETGVGIDILFFDAEDYGPHRFSDRSDNDFWALGAQHWARNPHQAGYHARYGILLDMVGASGATFLREGYSMLYAPRVVRKVWDTAQRLGYGHYFLREDGGYITDDHYYINTYRNIPTINIIHLDNTTPHGFFPQWHTTGDTMEVIDARTLEVVGKTVMQVIYEER